MPRMDLIRFDPLIPPGPYQNKSLRTCAEFALGPETERKQRKSSWLTSDHMSGIKVERVLEIFPRAASQPVTCWIVLHSGLIFATWVIKASREEKPFSFSDRCQHSSQQVMYLTCLVFWRGGGSCQQIDLFPFMVIQGDDLIQEQMMSFFFLTSPTYHISENIFKNIALTHVFGQQPLFKYTLFLHQSSVFHCSLTKLKEKIPIFIVRVGLQSLNFFGSCNAAECLRF